MVPQGAADTAQGSGADSMVGVNLGTVGSLFLGSGSHWVHFQGRHFTLTPSTAWLSSAL